MSGWIAISGGATGIGAATVRLLASRGQDIVLFHHNSSAAAESLATELGSWGRQIVSIQWDLTDPSKASEVVERLEDLEIELEGLVINHGFYERRLLEDLDYEAWRRTVSINLDGSFLLMETLQPYLLDGSAVVLVSSQLGSRGSVQGIDYAASKGGMNALAKSLCLALAPRGIRVNAVTPGFVDTAILAGDTPEKRVSRNEQVPLGRVGRPEEIATVIDFLLGQDSSYVSGAVIHANGGLYL